MQTIELKLKFCKKTFVTFSKLFLEPTNASMQKKTRQFNVKIFTGYWQWLLLTTLSWTFQEIQEIKAASLSVFKNIDVNETNLFLWKGLIVPVCKLT